MAEPEILTDSNQMLARGLAAKDAEIERLNAENDVHRRLAEDRAQQLGEIGELRAELARQAEIQVELEHQVADAEDLWQEARAENERLRAQNDELHRQIDYVRSLVWDDIPAARVLAHLRHTLDRPKGLGNPNGA